MIEGHWLWQAYGLSSSLGGVLVWAAGKLESLLFLVAYASTIFQEWLHVFKVLLGNLLHLIPIRAIKTRPICSLK